MTEHEYTREALEADYRTTTAFITRLLALQSDMVVASLNHTGAEKELSDAVLGIADMLSDTGALGSELVQAGIDEYEAEIEAEHERIESAMVRL